MDYNFYSTTTILFVDIGKIIDVLFYRLKKSRIVNGQKKDLFSTIMNIERNSFLLYINVHVNYFESGVRCYTDLNSKFLILSIKLILFILSEPSGLFPLVSEISKKTVLTN